MNVLFVCECDKRALSETRRILDQFAERRGSRTWQTSVTKLGLDTVRRLLRKTARKNTAVACHWVRGLDHTELLWIVGDASRFNVEGAVPTDTTVRNVLRREDEDDWHSLQDIRLLAQLAALLHDLGKASIAFQARLRGGLQERNLYRHEWVSLRLFLAFVGKDDDERWLRRLAEPDVFDDQLWTARSYQRDGVDADIERFPFRDLSPVAAAVGWLVVTHHRLPIVPVYEEGKQKWLGTRTGGFRRWWFEEPLPQVSHDWNETYEDAPLDKVLPYWELAGALPTLEPKWKALASRLASKLLGLLPQRPKGWLSNPYVMHLARLTLMLSDHHYSSLKKSSPLRALGGGTTQLYANTDADGSLKQPLDEHLLGVAHGAGLIASSLPSFVRHLPRLANHRGLRKRSADARFVWQDKAADAASSLRERAREHGAFVVNMASTGCGKTLGNARILYALAEPQAGLRATYALGLRTLTLQTGRSYRTDLHLGEDELAIRVGGSASRALFEYYEQKAEQHGSASVQALIEEDSHVLYEGNEAEHPLLQRALHDAQIRNLLAAPMLVCTVDHLTPATEAQRAGRQIAPMLRLMSADLVLDELDDYDLDDLPALTRLVHWAGLLGTRVVLSSATLPPALVEGMYLAYRAGREHYRLNRGEHGGHPVTALEVPCLWVDEFAVQQTTCADAAGFAAAHMQFVGKRAGQLRKVAALRRAEIVPIDRGTGRDESEQRAVFAGHVRDACLRLHHAHAETDPASGKRVSFGLVRMANIDPLFDVAKRLFELGAPEGTRIHLCVYHARFPLVQRSAIEHQLDHAFNRRGGAERVYQCAPIRAALDAHPEGDHLFVVIASPVCEVGRDWDADWAVVEPSSMRSLIQLAGRVQRHRGKQPASANVLVFDRNVKGVADKMDSQRDPLPVFVHPGFERAEKRFHLRSTRVSKLLAPEELDVLTALPRVLPRPADEWKTRERLVDLEHARIAVAMLPKDRLPSALAPSVNTMGRDEAAWSWQHPQATLSAVLAQQQPFREDSLPSVTLALLPDDAGERLLLHRVEDDKRKKGRSLYVLSEESKHHEERFDVGPRIGVWGSFDRMTLLAEQAEHLGLSLRTAAEKLATVEVPKSDQGWRAHPWLGFTKKR